MTDQRRPTDVRSMTPRRISSNAHVPDTSWYSLVVIRTPACSVSLSAFPPSFLPFVLPACLPACLTACLPACLPACRTACLPACLTA